MSFRRSLLVVSAIAIFGSGCSTRPRQFSAALKTPATDQNAYERDYQICQTLVGKGYKSNFKSTALKLGIGTAAGFAGGIAVGAVVAAATTPTVGTLGLNVVGAGAGAASIAFPVIGIGVGFGVSRAIRSGREKRVKAALATCLGEYGYSVDSWTLVKKVRKTKGKTPAPAPDPAIAATPVG